MDLISMAYYRVFNAFENHDRRRLLLLWFVSDIFLHDSMSSFIYRFSFGGKIPRADFSWSILRKSPLKLWTSMDNFSQLSTFLERSYRFPENIF